MDVVVYNDSMEAIWDAFVMNSSVNGTFLQTRRFLNYHAKGKFQDISLMLFDKKNELAAVIPACEVYVDEQKRFISHAGSTYGGIVVSGKYYSAEKLNGIISAMNLWLIKNGFGYVLLKLTNGELCTKSIDLLEYMLHLNGFSEYKELNTYVDLRSYPADTTSAFSQGKRTHINNCERAGMECRRVNDVDSITNIYRLLCESLQKYGVKPVHTLDELIDLGLNRISDCSEFYGVYLDGRMVAGGWVFLFSQTKTAHTQYLCADKALAKLSPMSFAYYSLIKEFYERKYNRIMWGISTENHGQVLNNNLTKSKEDYGSTYTINRTMYKEYNDEDKKAVDYR